MKAIETGLWHSCALTVDGRAYCWGGRNSGDQGLRHGPPAVLGSRTKDNSAVPVAVQGGLRFQSLSVGADHACGLTASGVAYCWGDPEGLRDGRADAALPAAVAPDRKWKKLSAGWGYTCGLAADARAYCWGQNDGGQLGDGSRSDSSEPVAVAGNLRFADIEVGGPSCGVTLEGVAYCWGSNERGELGNGSTTPSLAPTRVAADVLFTSITVGGLHACGVTTAGWAYCWGDNNSGQLGNGADIRDAPPISVAIVGRSLPAPAPMEAFPVRVVDPAR